MDSSILDKNHSNSLPNPFNDKLVDDDMILDNSSMFNFEIKSDQLTENFDKPNINCNLNQKQLDDIDNLLQEFTDIFSSVLPFQAARVPPFVVKLKEGGIVKNQRPRRLSSQNVAIFVDKKIDKLIECGVL